MKVHLKALKNWCDWLRSRSVQSWKSIFNFNMYSGPISQTWMNVIYVNNIKHLAEESLESIFSPILNCAKDRRILQNWIVARDPNKDRRISCGGGTAGLLPILFRELNVRLNQIKRFRKNAKPLYHSMLFLDLDFSSCDETNHDYTRCTCVVKNQAQSLVCIC